MSKKEQIVQLTNHDNNEDIYPVTMEDAIIDEDGNSTIDKINNNFDKLLKQNMIKFNIDRIFISGNVTVKSDSEGSILHISQNGNTLEQVAEIYHGKFEVGKEYRLIIRNAGEELTGINNITLNIYKDISHPILDDGISVTSILYGNDAGITFTAPYKDLYIIITVSASVKSYIFDGYIDFYLVKNSEFLGVDINTDLPTIKKLLERYNDSIKSYAIVEDNMNDNYIRLVQK